MRHSETLKTLIDQGLRVVSHPQPDLPVVYLGLAVGVGSRNETATEEGLAHFCEHMAFKGTERRSAMQIINRLEGVGGELNAFTTKEDTVLHAACERQHLSRAIDLLCDIAFHSQYPEEEMQREVEVVCDEIDSYEDNPSELIYDDFENLLFPSHPLGHAILGHTEQLRSYTREQLAAFAHRHYRPENAVLFVWGATLPQPLPAREGSLNTINISPPSQISAPRETRGFEGSGAGGGSLFVEKNTHQAHVMVGCRACAATSEDRPALYIINNMLGGPALNARLNIALRERRGLVYTVESSLACYSDTGAWTTYLGCDHKDVKRCLRLVHQELDRMMQHPLSQRQLDAARVQMHGQVALARQNLEQMAIDMGRTMLHEGRPRSLDEFLRQVDMLTPAQIQDTAQRYLDPSRMMTLIYR